LIRVLLEMWIYGKEEIKWRTDDRDKESIHDGRRRGNILYSEDDEILEIEARMGDLVLVLGRL
jgi:hypothetical protein